MGRYLYVDEEVHTSAIHDGGADAAHGDGGRLRLVAALGAVVFRDVLPQVLDAHSRPGDEDRQEDEHRGQSLPSSVFLLGIGHDLHFPTFFSLL